MLKRVKFFITTLLIILITTFTVYRFFPSVVQKALTKKKFYDAHLKIKSIELEDITYSYAEGGEKNDEIIVLVHGFNSDKSTKIAYAKKLMDKYHVILPDLPGHGQTTRPVNQKYDIYSLRDRLEEFMQAKKIDKPVTMIASSMGGGIVTVYAHKYPQKIKKMILINPLGALPPIQSDVQNQLDLGRNIFFPQNNEQIDEMFEYLIGKTLPIPNHFKTMLVKKCMDEQEFFEKAFQDLLTTTPVDDILKDINTPTLILVGEKDRVIHPSCITVYEKNMPNLKTKKLKDGHHIFINNCFHEAVFEMKSFLNDDNQSSDVKK
jgi:abhydrolase domain-containing protein 6